MTDAMFTFAWYALATYHTTGRNPQPGELRHNGGSARYQLYPTSDGKIVACGALEQHFWDAFTKSNRPCARIHRRRARCEGDRRAVRKIIAAKPAAHWQPIFAAADCCVTIVATLEEALRTRTLSSAGCSAGKSPRRMAAPCRPSPFRSRRNSGSTKNSAVPAIGRQQRRLKPFAAHQPRRRIVLRSEALTHQRTPEHSHPRSEIESKSARRMHGQKLGQQRPVHEFDGKRPRPHVGPPYALHRRS
jgi:hypothetical protein